MKVLHVINSLAAGGAERLVSDLLPLFPALGIEAELLALDARNDVFSGVLRQAGIPVTFARPRGANPYSPFRMRDVRRVIGERKPDIVHVHLAPAFHWCAVAVRGLPLVTTEHATLNRRMRNPALRTIERSCYKRYSRVACVSKDTARALAQWLDLPPERFPVIPNGVPFERFCRDTRPADDVTAWLDGRTGIAMTARLVPAKGHEVALKALTHLSAGLCMVFIGEGPERQRLEELAKRFGVASRCLFLGSRIDVPEVLAACDMYLQTSHVEGFGIAALEAMAAGRPVVASEAPGLGEVVRGAGKLFPVGDAEACADAIAHVVSDEAEKSRMRTMGLDRVKEYSIERCAERYARLYTDSMAKA